MLLALGLALSGAVLPALAEAESDVGDITMEAVNEAYDEAMLGTHSEMAFLTVPFLCQRLCDLMSFACGQAAEAADVAADNAADNAALQVVDTLIRQAEQCFPGGERTADAEAFERAVAAWEGRREGFLAASGDVGGFEPGLRMDDARVGKLVDAICLQMPCETRLDYLESAQNVCTAIWPLLRQALLSKAGEALDVPEVEGLDFAWIEEKATRAIDLISELKTKLSTLFDDWENAQRARLERIEARLNALDAAVTVVCRVVGLDEVDMWETE